MSGNVKISNAAIDLAPDGEVVLRGVIDPSSFTSLMVADYQREALPGERSNDRELGGSQWQVEGCFVHLDG